jgi:hypothetical protein
MFKMFLFPPSPPSIPRFLAETAENVPVFPKSIMGTLVTILIDLHMSSDKIVFIVIKSRGFRWVGHVTRMGRDVYRVMVGRLDGKRPLGRSRHRWEDNIKMDLQEVRCGGMGWIELA